MRTLFTLRIEQQSESRRSNSRLVCVIFWFQVSYWDWSTSTKWVFNRKMPTWEYSRSNLVVRRQRKKKNVSGSMSWFWCKKRWVIFGTAQNWIKKFNFILQIFQSVHPTMYCKKLLFSAAVKMQNTLSFYFQRRNGRRENRLSAVIGKYIRPSTSTSGFAGHKTNSWQVDSSR